MDEQQGKSLDEITSYVSFLEANLDHEVLRHTVKEIQKYVLTYGVDDKINSLRGRLSYRLAKRNI